MRWRPAPFSLLVFQLLWMNVVLPGHNRGIITVGTPECESCSVGAGAVFRDDIQRGCHAPASRDSRQHGRQPTPKDKANCAICAFAARVTPPPSVNLVPTGLGLLAVLPLPPPQFAVSLPFVPTYFGNGPPLM